MSDGIVLLCLTSPAPPPTGAALIFAIIVLGVAAYLDSILVSSDLSQSSSLCQLCVRRSPQLHYCSPCNSNLVRQFNRTATFIDFSIAVSLLTIFCTGAMCVPCSLLYEMLLVSLTFPPPCGPGSITQSLLWNPGTGLEDVSFVVCNGHRTNSLACPEHILDGRSV